ncbi:RDD family protein [[Mycobacterium] wendilense]|uniref:RDD family protein n=1 Tax=[Mycobacterium] wendilense TaxID=3064284 RepID=A0ABN9NYX6_9MYCO|nr:RDD family protein [Mycolicibacterium sp. MU0050]CAJ1583003.1 RDD family protein [Mycolicibacterium sp. MU0050]
MSTGDFDPNNPPPPQYGPPGGYPPPPPPQYGQPGGYPPPQYGAYPAPAGRPAGLGMRFLARIIDGIIVTVAAGLLSLLFAGLGDGEIAGMSTGWMVTGLFSGLLMFAYFVLFESNLGWTPGKKLLGLSVRGVGGAPKPDARQAAVRNLFTLLQLVPCLGWILAPIAYIVIAVTISGSPTKQGKHDEFAGGTQVVQG